MNKKTLGIIISIIIVIAIALIVIFNLKGKESSPTSSDVPSSKSSLTISDVISKFKSEGVNVNLEETKPYFSMIGAKDGEIFYLDEEPVKLYIFESEENYKNALNEYPFVKNMPKKDLVVIDTASSKALDIFNSL